MPPEIKRMWETGPLRQWADTKVGNNYNFYQNDAANLKGYAGSYVCDDCKQAVVGVYRQKVTFKWLCRACHELAASPKRLDSRKVKR